MSRQPNMPYAENCSLEVLDIAAGAAVSLRSHVRMMATKALLVGISHDQVAKLYHTTRRNLCRWIDRFNTSGIDGLVQKARSGRPRKITPDKRTKYIELVQCPDRSNETHWTGKKFHGYLTKQLDEEIGCRTLVRWLHEQGFRLKVPRSWPNGQDEEKRKDFVDLLRILLGDPEIDLWFLDETGIEGDPRPKRRWALKGQKNPSTLPGRSYKNECDWNRMPSYRRVLRLDIQSFRHSSIPNFSGSC